MTGTKRITDLTDYVSVLPYASELFGVYQPLIGWRSKRRVTRIGVAQSLERQSQLSALRRRFAGDAEVSFNVDRFPESARVAPGRIQSAVLRSQDSGLLGTLASRLQEQGAVPVGPDWNQVVNEAELVTVLNSVVFESHRQSYLDQFAQQHEHPQGAGAALDPLQSQLVARLREESSVAGLLLDLVQRGLYPQLVEIFYAAKTDADALQQALDALTATPDDPFLTFDPRSDVKDVTLSPVGVVHLFRQFFFELDTFLGTPVGHVWLSPGSTVELIEVSTRRTVVEKTIETALETTAKSERSTTDQDEISDAVKQQNRDDMKLGFSTTVNQSWGTGNATATGTLNMDKTQEQAREQGHKRMRQQTEKLSSEIRQNFKSTFKTTTETVDTSSKRYVLNNTTLELINYELRRKMRQVGVQIQDVGSYLCWETFVDDPGRDLSMPHLIHIAQPADLILVPDPKLMPLPPETVTVSFSGEAVWNYPDNSTQHNEDHPEVQGRFVPMATLDLPGIPQDYEVAFDPNDPFIPVQKQIVAAQDDNSWGANKWIFLGMIPAGREARDGRHGHLPQTQRDGVGRPDHVHRQRFRDLSALGC